MSVDDLLLFADLYHAPFNYGPRGAYMLSEFKWLKVIWKDGTIYLSRLSKEESIGFIGIIIGKRKE